MALDPKAPHGRKAAAAGLGSLDPQVAAAAIYTALQSPSNAVRAAAVEALWQLPHAVVHAVEGQPPLTLTREAPTGPDRASFDGVFI